MLDGGAVPRGLPQPTVDLLVMPDGACRLAGPETRGRQGTLPEGGPLVGVRLRPGTVTGLFGVAADEVPLAGAPIEVGHLGGSVTERLAGALALVRTRAGRCRVDERMPVVLAAMHARPGAPACRPGRVVRAATTAAFGVAIGLRPKSYVRVVRLHHALAAAHAAPAKGERPDWAASRFPLHPESRPPASRLRRRGAGEFDGVCELGGGPVQPAFDRCAALIGVVVDHRAEPADRADRLRGELRRAQVNGYPSLILQLNSEVDTVVAS